MLRSVSHTIINNRAAQKMGGNAVKAKKGVLKNIIQSQDVANPVSMPVMYQCSLPACQGGLETDSVRGKKGG